jgi:hypothetical protein
MLLSVRPNGLMTTDDVRCPYWVWKHQFKIMRFLDGKYAGEKCGHVDNPFRRSFVSGCQKCTQMNRRAA